MTKLPEPKKYFGLDTESDFSYYTEGQMRAYADAENAALREQMSMMAQYGKQPRKDPDAEADKMIAALREQVQVLRDALKTAEAALADIGDATREPGDDLAWCEARAAQALPAVRAALKATP